MQIRHLPSCDPGGCAFLTGSLTRLGLAALVTGVTPVGYSPAAFGIFHFGTEEAILVADVDLLYNELLVTVRETGGVGRWYPENNCVASVTAIK